MKKTKREANKREKKSRASKDWQAPCLVSIFLYSHSSFVVDWYFEHAANCGDFIIINLWIKSIHVETTAERTRKEKWSKLNSHIHFVELNIM